jgi:phosphoenolpyruvate synthase/pyruvate phosphate dikinase
MGLHNVKLMISVLSHIRKGEKLLAEMAKTKRLVQGINGLQVYVMIEI